MTEESGYDTASVFVRLRDFARLNLHGMCKWLSLGPDRCVCALCDLDRLEERVDESVEHMRWWDYGFARLGATRDLMKPEDVEAVQHFLMQAKVSDIDDNKVVALERRNALYQRWEQDFLKITETWEEHPDGWDWPCMCAGCRQSP